MVDKTEQKTEKVKDAKTGEIIDKILVKYPEHKRVLFLKAKYENNEELFPIDMSDLKRFITVVERKK